MSVEDYAEQLEYDLTWRREEIAFFENVGSELTEDEVKLYRRAVILMLYAHFEGFVKFSLELYVTMLNSRQHTCGEVNYALAAATLSDLFHDLRHPDKKCPEFPNILQDEPKLRIFGREQAFLKGVDAFENRAVSIPDGVVDMESNLKPIVLKKNLFRLGLDYSVFDNVMGDISKILGYRNKIAHGKCKAGIREEEYVDYKKSAFEVMESIRNQISSSLDTESYRRVG